MNTPTSPHSHTQSALIVFAKPPVAGTVKTRLTALLAPEEAAQLYDAFLRDALAQYAALPAAVRLYLSPPAEEAPANSAPLDLAPAGVTTHVQRGAGLGARMQQAFVETFAAGFERIVIIGTDHPTLPSAFIEQAFAALQERLSVVIGPSEDGGYYLLGLNELYPQLFRDMTYSHSAVFSETLARVQETAARLTVLPCWYDVDTPENLRRLTRELLARAPSAGEQPEAASDAALPAPRTQTIIKKLVGTHPSLQAKDERAGG